MTERWQSRMTAIASMVRYLVNAKPWVPDRDPLRTKRCTGCGLQKAWNQFTFGTRCKECGPRKDAR